MLLVSLFVLAAVAIASGVIVLAAPKRVRAFIQDFRTTLFGGRWANGQPMIYTPIVGGIGLIAIGGAVIVVLVSQGTTAIQ